MICDTVFSKTHSCGGHVGHVARIDPNLNYVHKAYKRDFKKKRPPGRPPKRWSYLIREDTGSPLLTAERHARDIFVEVYSKFCKMCQI